MKVIAKSKIAEGGAVRLPGEVFEVDEERFKSLGDVVDEAPEVPEEEIPETDPEADPEKGDPEPDLKKLSPLDKLRNMFGFSGGKVDLDISNLENISREDLDAINKDQINDLFASVEDLVLKPSMKKGEMIDAVLVYIEQAKEDGSGDDKTE